MYSQNNEEEHILAAVERLGKPGTFLDIGAWDGVTYSNTRALAERGWGGVVVEASPINVCKLLDLYGDRQDITVVNAAVTVWRNHAARFYDSGGDGISSLEASALTRWKSTKFRSFMLQTFPLSEFLGVFTQNLDVVSIDVEGGSMDLFRIFPFLERGTRVVIVEHDGMIIEATTIGKAQGFRVADVNAENVVLVRP